jgi:pentatricopeptide repeat protein
LSCLRIISAKALILITPIGCFSRSVADIVSARKTVVLDGAGTLKLNDFISIFMPQSQFHLIIGIFLIFQRAMQTIKEMEALGVKPNLKTYTTLIHGWARASLPEKALRCFEQMKSAGLKPDKAVYHCLMTSLLSRATVAEAYIYSGVLSICREMVECGLTFDMGTAVHWSKCLRKIERTGGELTEALQKTFPPDWNSRHTSDANSSIDTDDESDNSDDDNVYFTGRTDVDEDHYDVDDDLRHRSWI